MVLRYVPRPWSSPGAAGGFRREATSVVRYLRTPVRHEGVDGMGTDQPARAVEERAAVHADTGFGQWLEDTVRGIVDR